LSKKYNEIMDKVVVTDEMRQRILTEIGSADPARLESLKMGADEESVRTFTGRKRFPAAKILAGLAVACVLILIAGIIRFSMPVMSPSSAGSAEYEEAKDYASEEAEADTMVGAQDAGVQPALTGSGTENGGTTNAAPGAADGGNAGVKSETAAGGAVGAAADRSDDEAAAEGITDDRADMSVRLGEPEIRKIVEKYIGSEFEISDTDIEESVLIYTVSGVQSGEIFSYIRIDVSDGSAEIENVQTGEISTLTFREMAGQ
jgi:hypothetical protein